MRRTLQLLPLLLLTLSAGAQPMTLNDPILPFDLTQASAANPTNFLLSLPGLEHLWIASDLTVNAAVNVWTDRIGGVTWYKGGGTAKAPTNSASGVVFGAFANQMLTNQQTRGVAPGSATMSLQTTGFTSALPAGLRGST